MKLLKVILVTIIFLQGIAISYAAKFHQPGTIQLKSDTVKSRHKHKKLWTASEIRRLAKEHKVSYDDCVFTGRYSIKSRLKKYPFSKAVKILAVSYPAEMQGPMDDSDRLKFDTLKLGLHIKDGILNYQSLKEIKQLNKQQIIRLTNIIYNADYRKKIGLNDEVHGECFEPRNALIFYDKNGKIFDYLEVCFECLGAESPTNKISVGTICNQKYSLLKHFFINTGIKYGTIKHE